MFNVLTKDLKDEIKKDYKSRRLIIYFVFLEITTLLLLVSFVSINMFIISVKRNLEVESDFLVKSESFKDGDLTAKTFDRTNKYLLVLSKDKPLYSSDLINEIISKKNNSIKINQVDFSKITATTSSLSVKGISSTRESLLLFVKNLSSDKTLEVNLPVSNFAKDKDIDFSFDIKKTYEIKQ